MMPSLSGSQQRESRRSTRLVSSRLYPHDDDTASTSSTGSVGQISYRESPVRVFKKKSGPRKGGGASVNHVSNASKSLNTGLSDAPTARKSSASRASSSSMTPLSDSALSTLTRMDPAGFSSGYSSSEEGHDSAHTPAEEETESQGALATIARVVAVLYFWLGVAWYSITSGMSLLDVSLLSRRTTGMRKTLLLLFLFILLLFGVWYWYPYVIAQFPRSSSAPPVRPHTTPHTHVQPRVDERVALATFAALEEEFSADLREHDAKWMEYRSKDLEDVLKEIRLLKQDGEKHHRTYEMLQMDVQDLKIRARKFELEHRRLIKEETKGMQNQISELGLDMSKLQSASEHLSRRMDTQESDNRKLKTELSDWLLQQMSGSLNSAHDAVMHPELQRALEDLEKKILDKLGEERENEKDVWRTVGKTLQEEGVGAVTVTDVDRIVHRALSLHRADGIGMADFALESSGASVVNTRCSETYHTRSACISLFGFTLWYPSESPRTVIQPELYPGKCWPFRGSQGFLVIALSHPVQITHVTLEHLPRVLSPSGHIDSAPKDFAVYGLINEEDKEGKLLGTFLYDQDREPIQTFEVERSLIEVYSLVELRVLSNWGHPEYTCVYRFRVHGQPIPA